MNEMTLRPRKSLTTPSMLLTAGMSDEEIKSLALVELEDDLTWLFEQSKAGLINHARKSVLHEQLSERNREVWGLFSEVVEKPPSKLPS